MRPEPRRLTLRLLRATLQIAAGTALVKVVVFAREMVVAAAVGVGGFVDAYVLAFAMQTFVTALFANAVQTAVMPAYARLSKHPHPGEAQAFATLVTVLTLGGFALIAGVAWVLFVGLNGSIAVQLPAEAARFSRTVFALLALTIPLLGLSSVLTGLLGVKERFTSGALAPLAVPAAVIGAVTLLPPSVTVAERIGWVAVGQIVGCGVQLGWLLWSAVAAGVIRFGALQWQRLRSFASETGTEFGYLAFSNLILAAMPVVDNVLAARLPVGTLSSMAYADRLTSMLVGTAAVVVSSAAAPYFASLAASGDWSALDRLRRSYLRMVWTAALPVVALVLLSANGIVALAFQRGAFTAADSVAVGQVLRAAILQLPFFVGGMILARLLVAMQLGRVFIVGNLISLSLKLTLGYLLMRPLGVTGIALSTSLVYGVAYLYLSRRYTRGLGQLMAAG